MEDKLQTLHTNLVKEGYDLPDFSTFKTDMSDPVKSQKLHDNLITAGYDLPDYGTFINDMGLKKKDISGQDAFTSASGKEELPFLGQSGKNLVNPQESSTPTSPSTSVERPEVLDKLGLSIDTPKPTGFKEDNIGTRGLEYLSGETRDFAEEERKQLQNQIKITPSTQVLHPDNIITGSTPGSLIADYLKGKPIPRDSPKAETLGEKILSVPHEVANAFGKFFDDIANTGKAAESGFAQLFLGKEGSDVYMKIKGASDLPNSMSMHPAQTLSTFLDKSTERWKEMPEGVGWSVGKGLIDIAPDIAATLLFPEGKVGMLASKYGLKLGKFALEQASRGYAQGIGESNGSFGLQLKMPVIRGLEKGAMGWMYETMGGMNKTLVNNMVNKLLPNPTTTSEILNKALFENGAISLSDGFTFGGLSALDEFLQTGKITADNVAIGFGTGLAFHAIDGAKLMAAKGLNTILGMPSTGITNLAKSEMSVTDMNKQADDIISKLENRTSDNPEGDAVMAFMLKRAAQAKAVSEEVLNNKDGLILDVKSSTLDTKVKNLLIDKINEVDADNDPKIQQTKDITEKISKIDDALDDIRSNNSWDETRKEIESAPLKERKEELKEEAKKVYGIEPKEKEEGAVEKPKAVQTEASQKLLDELDSYKLGDKTFKSKKELTDWLDKNYNENDRFTSVNEEGYLESNTMKVFNDWYKDNKERLAKEEIDRIDKELQTKKEEETKNAEGNRDEDQGIVNKSAPQVEQGKGNVDNVGNDEQKGATQEEVKHAEDIKTQFRDVFSKKNIPSDQIEGAIALMDARAKSWASEEKGRTPEQWYQRIAGIKEGEFQDKSTPRLYQLPDGRQVMGLPDVETTNGFYSPIEKRLADFKQEKASVNKWKEIIGKGDEATFTGVLDYLNKLKPDQSLTKTEINQFMKDNRIEVVEIVKGEVDKIPEKVLFDAIKKQQPNFIDYTWREGGYSDGKYIDYPSERFLLNEGISINQEIQDFYNNRGGYETMGKQPKYSQYQTAGEKDNYKEVLVTMPPKVPSLKLPKFWEVKEVEGFYHVIDASGDLRASASTKEEAIKKAQEGILEHRLIQPTSENEFKSGHFDEPNILVHLRMNTRIDAEGKKVLFLEEVQSDWGQKGKKEGFKTKVDKEKTQKRIAEIDKELDGLKTGQEEKFGELRRERWTLSQSLINPEQAVPSAPFVTDTNAWTKLGLKVALKEAIKQGVDKIVWTTGEQQNERYDLSKQVESVMLSLDGSLSVVKKGENNYTVIAGNVRESHLADHIGKEAAQKLSEQKPNDNGDKILSGVDLKLGGKGMIGFYGSPEGKTLGIVGNVAKSLFKQEPKTINMATKDVNVNEKMVRENGVPIEYNKARNFNFDGDNLLYAQKEGGSLHRIHSFFELGLAKDEKLLQVTPDVYVKQHSIDITPTLKAEVEKGLPLFQKEGKGKPKGAVETLADGNLIIHALSRPDFSTMVHEIIHTFEKDLNPDEIKSLETWSKAKQGTTTFKEAFARAGERYLRDGKAPTEALKPIFQKFKEWLTNIYQSLKGSPIEKKLSPQVKSIFDRLLSETDNTLGKVPQVENKPLEPPQPPSEGNIPPAGESGSEASKQGENGDINERTLLLRFRNAQNITPEFKKDLDENVNYTYKSIPNTATQADVDYLIAQKGIAETERAVLSTTSGLAPRVRMLAGVRVMKAMGELAENAKTDGDLKAEADYRKRRVDMAQNLSDKAWEMGAGIQILGSKEVMAELKPVEHVMIQKQLMREQRDNMLNRNKKDVNKKKKEFEKANEEAIAEVIGSKEYEDLKKRVEELEKKLAEKPKPTTPPKEKPTSEVQAKIKKEQDYRKTQWDIILKGKQTSVSAIGLSSEQIEAFGNIVGSYVREGVTRTQDLIDRLKKEYFKASGGKILSDEDIAKIMPEKVDGKLLKDIETEGETKAAVEKLATRIDKMLKDPEVPKDDPVKQMIDSLFEKVKEKDTKEKVLITKKTALEKIQEALLNKQKYADVWEKAKEEVLLKINTNEALTEEQKSEYNKRLADFYNEVIGEPFSEKQVGEATRKGIKDEGINIDQVVRDHYTVYDATKKSLQEKLVDKLGLSPADAKLLSDAIGKQFDKIAIAKKQAILKKGITAKEIVRSKTAKEVWQKLIEDSNLGAFSDSEFAEAYADKWGFPKLTDEQATEIERLSTRVLKAPEGFQKYEAIQDLLKYQVGLPGIDKGQLGTSMWYGFILSGVRTQWKNILQNNLQSFGEFFVASTHGLLSGNPFAYQYLREGFGKGINRGRFEAGHILKKGYNPIKGGKIEAPGTTEMLRPPREKPFNIVNTVAWASRYVTRWMVAADMVSYAGLKEMRSYELAMHMARVENKMADKPTMSMWGRANEILNHTSERRAEAEKQTEMEGLKGNAAKRRIWEIMEQARPKEMIEDANNFAARGTFNHQTEGVLGLMTDAVNTVIQKTEMKMVNPFTDKTITLQPLKLVVPFTRIIANVANTALDYFPITGGVRAISGQMGLESMGNKYRKYSTEERQKLAIKASIGLASMVGLYLWSHHKDEKGESFFEITANGTGDYQKNNELKERGWQAYSIRIGDKWISYQYTPLVLSLAPIGIMNDAQKYQADMVKDKDLLGLLGFATYKNLAVMSDMTWASSVSSLMGALSTGDINKGQSFMTNLATSTAKGFIYPKIIEQSVQAYDAIQKNPRKDAQGLAGKIMRDLPIVRGKYKPMLNVVGEPVHYDFFQMVGKEKNDPFWDYLDKHDIFIGKIQPKTPIYDDINKVERGMTDDEYYEFVKKSGQEIRKRIEDEVMSEKLSEDDLKKDITNIKTEVRNKFKTEMFGWGDLRTNHPQDWQKLRDNDALQVPHSSVLLKIDKKNVRFGTDKGVPSPELHEVNEAASEKYRELMLKYFQDMPKVADDKKTIVKLIVNGEEKPTSMFDIKIKAMWTTATQIAKKQAEEKLKAK